MTSPAPLSIYNPICSYCWKESKEPLFFMTKKGDFHWACCQEHKKEILEDEEESMEGALIYFAPINFNGAFIIKNKMIIKTYQNGRLYDIYFVKSNIIGNFKNPLVSREQLNKQGVTNG